jgi:hypothetical protein
MPFGLRCLTFTFALVFGFTFVAPTATAAHHPKHSEHGKKKKHSKSKTKTKGKKKKFKKKKKKAHHRRPKHHSAYRSYNTSAPHAASLTPGIVRAAPTAPSPYGASPSGPTLPPHTVIPLHDPKAPVEEHNVRLDMTKPYGAATQIPTPAEAKRGLASEPLVTSP